VWDLVKKIFNSSAMSSFFVRETGDLHRDSSP